MTIKILLDTDIGTDIDDAVCLAYLLAQPQAELLGITTVTGEAYKRAMLASALCHAAGKHIPIYPGVENPLIVHPIQTHAQQAAALGTWKHDTEFPAGQAIDFLRATIRSHPNEITLLAIGPLTNIALLFAIDPEIPLLLKSLVMMNGYYLDSKRYPEWNIKLDPHAAHIVFRDSPAITRAVGLDVTTRVQMPADEVRERFHAPLLRPVLDFAEVWFKERDTITFHDPLAAAIRFDETICEFESGQVEIELSERDTQGLTHLNAKANRHQVGRSVNPQRFFEHFFSVF
jgi:purine nucleosidase